MAIRQHPFDQSESPMELVTVFLAVLPPHAVAQSSSTPTVIKRKEPNGNAVTRLR